jgi:hypothetical protein
MIGLSVVGGLGALLALSLTGIFIKRRMETKRRFRRKKELDDVWDFSRVTSGSSNGSMPSMGSFGGEFQQPYRTNNSPGGSVWTDITPTANELYNPYY